MKPETFCVVDVESWSATNIDRGPKLYFDDKSSGLFCVAYQLPGKKTKAVWLADGQKLPAELLNFKGRFVAHTWFFEWCAFVKFFPKSRLAKLENWLCTQAMSRRFGLAAPRSSLEAVAALLKLPVQKNPDGKRLINTYSVPDKKTGKFKPVSAADKAAWLKYNADDVDTEALLFARLWSRFSDDEKEVFEADKRQQARGVPIDLAGVNALIKAEEKFTQNAQKEAERIAGRNAAGTLILSGTGEFLKWLKREHGVELPNAQAATIAELLETARAGFDSKLRTPDGEVVTAYDGPLIQALEIRQALMSRAAGKAAKLLERTSPDGRYYNPSTYGAAHTGRWQSWGVNFFNFYKFPVASEDWEKAAKACTKKPTKRALAELQRGLICAPPGKKLITTDWRGIENYLSLCYSGDTEQLRKVEAGESQYLIFGAKLFGRLITKKDAKEYNIAKIAVLSLGYGAGAAKFAGMVKQQSGIEITEAQSQRIVNVWRNSNRYVTTAWKAVENCFRNALSGTASEWHGFKFERAGTQTVTVTLPNDYELFYTGCGVSGRELCWKPDGVTPEKLYGGLLWENFMQAIAAQLLRRALVACENAGVEIVLHVYDEIVAEAKDKQAQRIGALITKIMKAAPPWAPAMKLEVEQKITKRWGK